MSRKLPIRYENMATPQMSTNAPIYLSTSLWGTRSPNPTVDSVVNA